MFCNVALDLCRLLDWRLAKKSILRTKETEAVLNLIFNDYCKTSIVLGQTTEITEVKDSMINPNSNLVNYLEDESNDNDKDDNGVDVTERMQQRPINKVNAFQRISKLTTAIDILKWHALRGLPILEKVALDYLATPASSSHLEQANSIATGTWDNQSRLSNKIFMQKSAYNHG